jgi:hypothetical protein
MAFKRIITFAIMVVLLGILNCTNDPPEPTGTFKVVFSGNITNQLQGQATFTLTPSNSFGRIEVILAESSSTYLRLTFYNPDASQIFLEPGSYSVVEQAGQNVPDEVLVDYVTSMGSISAASGEVRVGIAKENQIKGDLVNIKFNLPDATCNGTFDAIPK